MHETGHETSEFLSSDEEANGFGDLVVDSLPLDNISDEEADGWGDLVVDSQTSSSDKALQEAKAEIEVYKQKMKALQTEIDEREGGRADQWIAVRVEGDDGGVQAEVERYKEKETRWDSCQLAFNRGNEEDFDG